jgi:hypothetical protein
MTVYTFRLSRVHVTNPADLNQDSTISWRLEGTGSNPLTADMFAGGVMPSGTLTFQELETGRETSFETTAGPLPSTDLTGQLVLHTPVNCKIDPTKAVHALTMRGDVILAPVWALGPDVNTGWVVAKDGSASFVQLPTGVRAIGGSMDGGFENGIAFVSKKVLTPPYRLGMTVMRRDESTPDADNTELFLLALCGVKGVGGDPTDVSTWNFSGVVPGSHYFRDRTRGGRVTLFYQTQADPSTDRMPSFAVFDEAATSLSLTPSAAWPQQRNVAIRYEFDVTGGETFTLRQIIGGTTREASVTNGDVSKLQGGNVVLLINAGRTVDVTDLTVEPLRIIGTAGPFDLVESNFAVHGPAGEGARLRWILPEDGTGAPADFATDVPAADLPLYYRSWPTSFLRTRNATPSTLQSMLNDLAPGDDIVLAAGNYTSSYTNTRSGTPTNRVRVRAATWGAAVFGAGGSLNNSGSDIGFWGLKLTSTPSQKVQNSGNRTRWCVWVTACPWGDEQQAIYDTGEYTHVDRCEVHDTEAGFYRWRPGGLKPWIRRNHLYRLNSGESGGAIHNETIQIGGSSDSSLTSIRAVVEYNFMHDIGPGVDAEAFWSNKSSDNVYANNHMQNFGVSGFNTKRQAQHRHGKRCKYKKNRFVNHDLKINDWRQVAISNHVSGTGQLCINAGSNYYGESQAQAADNMAAADEVMLVDNRADIFFGDDTYEDSSKGPRNCKFSGTKPNKKADGTIIDAMGDMTIGTAAVGTTDFNAVTGYEDEAGEPVTLTSSLVGQAYPEDSSTVVTSTGYGVEFRSAANTDNNNLVILYKEQLPDHFEWKFRLEVTERDAADAGGRWFNAIHGMFGTGTFPRDVTTWVASQFAPEGGAAAADSVYLSRANMGRITCLTDTTVAENRNEARDVELINGVQTRLPPIPDPPVFTTPPVGGFYDLTIRKSCKELSITNDVTGQSVRWTADGILRRDSWGGYRSGRGRGFILRHRGDLPLIRELPEPEGCTEVPPPPPPPNGSFPHGPWRKMSAIPTSGANRKGPFSTAAELNTAISNARDGDFLLLPEGGTISGTININKALSETNGRYYITTNTTSEDPASFCKFTGSINFSGARGAVLNGFRYDGGGYQQNPRVNLNNSRLCQIERGLINNVVGGGDNTSHGYYGQWAAINGGCENLLFGFLQTTNCSGMVIDISSSAYPSKVLITHLHLIGTAEPGSCHKPGRTPYNGLHDTQIVLQDTFDDRFSSESVWTEFKYGGAQVLRCTIDARTSQGGSGADLRIRQGRLGPPGKRAGWNTDGPGPERGDLFQHNLFLCRATGAKPEITLRGAYHQVLENWAIVPDGDRQPDLNSTLANTGILCWGAQRDGRKFPEIANEPEGKPRRQSAYGCTIAGNRGFTVRSGWDDSAQTFKPDAHIIPTSGASRNSGVTRPGIWGTNCNFNATVSGVSIDRIPRRLFAGDVGPRQWRRLFIV